MNLEFVQLFCLHASVVLWFVRLEVEVETCFGCLFLSFLSE